MKSHTTILSIVFGFLVINLFVDSALILYCLIGIMAGSLFSETFSDFIERLWNGLAKVLSYIFPNILLSLVFYLILTPLAILSRIFKGNSDYTRKNPSGTVFRTTNKSFRKDSFERAW